MLFESLELLDHRKLVAPNRLLESIAPLPVQNANVWRMLEKHADGEKIAFRRGNVERGVSKRVLGVHVCKPLFEKSRNARSKARLNGLVKQCASIGHDELDAGQCFVAAEKFPQQRGEAPRAPFVNRCLQSDPSSAVLKIIRCAKAEKQHNDSILSRGRSKVQRSSAIGGRPQRHFVHVGVGINKTPDDSLEPAFCSHVHCAHPTADVRSIHIVCSCSFFEGFLHLPQIALKEVDFLNKNKHKQTCPFVVLLAL